MSPLAGPCTASAIRVGISCGLNQPQSPPSSALGTVTLGNGQLAEVAPSFRDARMRSILALAALSCSAFRLSGSATWIWPI